VRERAQLVERLVHLVLEDVQAIRPARGIAPDELLRQLELDPQGDEALLGAVVQIALDAAALAISLASALSWTMAATTWPRRRTSDSVRPSPGGRSRSRRPAESIHAPGAEGCGRRISSIGSPKASATLRRSARTSGAPAARSAKRSSASAANSRHRKAVNRNATDTAGTASASDHDTTPT
jgi:hypothetical protein